MEILISTSISSTTFQVYSQLFYKHFKHHYPNLKKCRTKTRGGSRTAAASKMEHFVIIITKCSILDVAAVLDPPLKTVLRQDHELFTHKIIKIKYFGKMNTFCIYLYHLNFLAGNSICFKKSQFSKIRKLLREILQAFLAVKLNYGNKTPLTNFQFPKANFLRMFKPYHSSYFAKYLGTAPWHIYISVFILVQRFNQKEFKQTQK